LWLVEIKAKQVTF